MSLDVRSDRLVQLVIATSHFILLASQLVQSSQVFRLISDDASTNSRLRPTLDLQNTNHQQHIEERSELDTTIQPGNFTVRSEKIKSLEGRTRKLPDAIIIGVKKGGTRALLEFLKVHPDVRAPGPEIHFFDRQYHKGLDWYKSRMPATLDVQLTVEKTPSYFVTKSVAQRVSSMSQDVKLIVVVRDPVTRALSDYTQARLKRPDLPSFETMAFSNATARRRRSYDVSSVNTSWGAIRIGLYARYLDRWLSWFPVDRFHFVSGERLVVDPAGELGRLQDFLGVKRLITDKHFYYNATKGFPCLKKAERGGGPRCLGQSKGRTHPVVSTAALRRLRNFYRPHNRRFYELTGINFGWN